MNNLTRNEVKQLATQISILAKQVADKLENQEALNAVILTANELVKNTSTFTFTLGSLYQEASVDTTSTPVANKPKVKYNKFNYYNKRDSKGRFSST